MQEGKQKKSPIKQRILQFVDTLGISKRDFYAQTNISRGTLESETGITEDTITKVFATFPMLSPTWTITGLGKMLNEEELSNKNTYLNTHPNTHLSLNKSSNSLDDSLPTSEKKEGDISSNDLIRSLIEQLKEQSEEIGALKQENFMLKHRLEEIADSAPDVNTAHG